MKMPAVPVVANVTTQPVSDPATIRDLLVEQVTGVVRWRESVSFMADQGVESVFEVGAGKVLSGLARRINRDLSAVSVGTPEDIETVASSL